MPWCYGCGLGTSDASEAFYRMWMVCALVCRELELTVWVMWRPCEVDVRCYPDVRGLNVALCGAYYSEQRCGCAFPYLEWNVIGGDFLCCRVKRSVLVRCLFGVDVWNFQEVRLIDAVFLRTGSVRWSALSGGVLCPGFCCLTVRVSVLDGCSLCTAYTVRLTEYQSQKPPIILKLWWCTCDQTVIMRSHRRSPSEEPNKLFHLPKEHQRVQVPPYAEAIRMADLHSLNLLHSTLTLNTYTYYYLLWAG